MNRIQEIEMTPTIFEAAFKPDATPEQIELVNRAVAKVEFCKNGIPVMSGWYSDITKRYVQDPRNSERVIRKAIEMSPKHYLVNLRTLATQGDSPVRPELAPQSARLYAAWKTLGGE